MTNKSRTLYTGVTNDLERRVYEHKKKLVPGFTTKYNITRLVYFEVTQDVGAAIAREKQIKGWLRTKKIALIDSVNPGWRDLSVRLVTVKQRCPAGKLILRRTPLTAVPLDPSLSLRMTASEGLADNGNGKRIHRVFKWVKGFSSPARIPEWARLFLPAA